MGLFDEFITDADREEKKSEIEWKRNEEKEIEACETLLKKIKDDLKEVFSDELQDYWSKDEPHEILLERDGTICHCKIVVPKKYYNLFGDAVKHSARLGSDVMEIYFYFRHIEPMETLKRLYETIFLAMRIKYKFSDKIVSPMSVSFIRDLDN